MLYPNKWRERVHLDNMEAWCRICITLIPHIAEARDIALSLTSNMVHQMNDGHGREDKPMGNEIVDPTSPPVMLHCPKPLLKSLSVHIERGGETSGVCGRYAQVELKE